MNQYIIVLFTSCKKFDRFPIEVTKPKLVLADWIGIFCFICIFEAMDILEKLPISHLTEVLGLIDMDINDTGLQFIGTYECVKVRGWEKAQNELKANLYQVMEVLQQDDIILDKEQKLQLLQKNIDLIDDVDFESKAFQDTHQGNYIKSVKSLTRSRIPRTYSEDVLKSENPNISEYKRLFRLVSPSTFIRYPVSEAYQVFNGEVSLFYKNNNVRKNPGIEMMDACLKRAIELYNDAKVCPFSYILIPSTLSKDTRMLRIISGQRFNGRAGSGITQELKNVDGKFQLIGTYDDWRS